jgi:hypothetical protein
MEYPGEDEKDTSLAAVAVLIGAFADVKEG